MKHPAKIFRYLDFQRNKVKILFMKISLATLCSDCSNPEEKHLSGYIQDVEIRDDNSYKSVCPRGHNNIIVIQNQKFELLFDFGARALLDGYTREAVASFAASLERFYEFYIKVLRLKHQISDSEFEKSWKLVSNQSERQLGAFLFLYLLENRKAIDFQDINKQVKFRNDVIHKGYIPLTEEVLKYGEIVLNFVFTVSKELKISAQEFITNAIRQPVDEKMREYKVIQSYMLDTILGFELNPWLILKGENAENYTFQSELENLERREQEKGYHLSPIRFNKEEARQLAEG